MTDKEKLRLAAKTFKLFVHFAQRGVAGACHYEGAGRHAAYLKELFEKVGEFSVANLGEIGSNGYEQLPGKLAELEKDYEACRAAGIIPGGVDNNSYQNQINERGR